MLSCLYAQQTFSPDNFPQPSRMQRVHSVAQYAVFDTSSAAMTANSCGLNPHLIQLPTLTLSYPSISTLPSCSRLVRRGGSARRLFSGPDSIRPHKKEASPAFPNTPAFCRIHRQQFQGATSDPLAHVWGDWGI